MTAYKNHGIGDKNSINGLINRIDLTEAVNLRLCQKKFYKLKQKERKKE